MRNHDVIIIMFMLCFCDESVWINNNNVVASVSDRIHQLEVLTGHTYLFIARLQYHIEMTIIRIFLMYFLYKAGLL